MVGDSPIQENLDAFTSPLFLSVGISLYTTSFILFAIHLTRDEDLKSSIFTTNTRDLLD